MDADWPVEGRGPQGAGGSRGCVLALSSCPLSTRECEHPWIGVWVGRQHVADDRYYILFPFTKCPFSTFYKTDGPASLPLFQNFQGSCPQVPMILPDNPVSSPPTSLCPVALGPFRLRPSLPGPLQRHLLVCGQHCSWCARNPAMAPPVPCQLLSLIPRSSLSMAPAPTLLSASSPVSHLEIGTCCPSLPSLEPPMTNESWSLRT